MAPAAFNPFTDPAPAERPLANAPLVRVLAQVRFAPILRIGDPSGIGIADFQEAIRKIYPVMIMDQQAGFTLTIGPLGQPLPPSAQTTNVWRFHDAEQHWRISLSTEFLSIETQHYSGRKDFLRRTRQLLDALFKAVGPNLRQRVGVRYINAIPEAQLGDLHRLVTPELSGISGTPFADTLQQTAGHAMHSVPEGTFLLNWGLLPPNATPDPNLLLPVPERQWILDLDCFEEAQKPFNSANIAKDLGALAERVYGVFRWAVTDEFLKVYDNG